MYCARRIPEHLRCTQCSILLPYRYLLPTVYLFMADIVNPDLLLEGLPWKGDLPS